MRGLIKREALLIVLIIVAGFILYANSLNNSFIWDDGALVRHNTYIKDYSHLPKVFTHDIGAGAIRKSNSYRPLQIFSYMLDYSLWGLNARGYHLTNMILHILVALSLYWLISILYGDRLLSFITSLFFLAHPIQTEAVAYISGRADSLAALFMFLSFILYIKYLDLKRTAFYILMLLSCLLALLSRENSFILPAILLLYHYSFKKKLNIKSLISVILVIFVYIFIRIAALKSVIPHPPAAGTVLQRIPGFFIATTNYIKLMFFPFGLHMEYGAKLFKITNPGAIAGALILISLLIYGFRKRDTDRLIFFSIYWFFITLLPSSNLYPVNAYMAEHWLYIPSVGFFLILANILRRLFQAGRLKTFAVIFIAALLIFYSCLTIRQNAYWSKPLTFYERTLRYTPDSARVYYNLAIIHKEDGKYQKAKEFFRKAIDINPEYVHAYNHFGILYYEIGKYQKAIELYKKALEIDPDYAHTYNNLGNAYSAIGKYQEAIRLYKKAIELDADYSYAYNNFGLAYYELGKYQEAAELYRKALEIEPDYAYAYNNLGMVYYRNGEYKEAIRFFSKSIELDPEYAIAHFNIAVAYFREEEYELSVQHCKRATELGHNVDPEFLKLLKSL